MFSALAWADVLITLDRMHFNDWMGKTFYGLSILRRERFWKPSVMLDDCDEMMDATIDVLGLGYTAVDELLYVQRAPGGG